MGDYFLSGLKTLKNSLIKEVRGRGLMTGFELISDKINARNYCESLKYNGVLCKETHDNIIRFAQPLVVKKRRY
ncbi:aminotransferase class III-fold pyridoxal phosphate-dependent enzyme [Desulfobacula toluolica]|uniref:Aminotransferase class III domain protein n=1 Tax=Desulfobacula toluolica (strain DSM 7467 / Tol2) TaxID=651182 RepID=K0NFG5_DESTT|nr:aminotransferase class III domain protein [Desulfobacula toluolica Tol2]